MHCERNVCAIGAEIIIRGENVDGMAGGNGAEKKIRVVTLHTCPAAVIVKFSSGLVIFRHERKINKCPQLVAQGAKLDLFANTGQYLLPYRADHDYALFIAQLFQLPHLRSMGTYLQRLFVETKKGHPLMGWPFLLFPFSCCYLSVNIRIMRRSGSAAPHSS